MIKDLIKINLIYLLVIPLINLGDLFPKNDVGILSLFGALFFIPLYGIDGILGWILGLVSSMIGLTSIYFLYIKLKFPKALCIVLIVLFFTGIFIFNAQSFEWTAF